MKFNAEAFETGKTSTVAIVAAGIRDFCALPRPVAARGFEDYAFPSNLTVDGVDIELKSGLVSIVVRGTYGWRIEILSEQVSVEERGGEKL